MDQNYKDSANLINFILTYSVNIKAGKIYDEISLLPVKKLLTMIRIENEVIA